MGILRDIYYQQSPKMFDILLCFCVSKQKCKYTSFQYNVLHRMLLLCKLVVKQHNTDITSKFLKINHVFLQSIIVPYAQNSIKERPNSLFLRKRITSTTGYYIKWVILNNHLLWLSISTVYIIMFTGL